MHCSLKNRFTFSHSILARELVSQLAHMGFHNGLSELGIQVTSINHHLWIVCMSLPQESSLLCRYPIIVSNWDRVLLLSSRGLGLVAFKSNVVGWLSTGPSSWPEIEVGKRIRVRTDLSIFSILDMQQKVSTGWPANLKDVMTFSTCNKIRPATCTTTGSWHYQTFDVRNSIECCPAHSKSFFHLLCIGNAAVWIAAKTTTNMFTSFPSLIHKNITLAIQ
jgi:hypothetical protein